MSEQARYPALSALESKLTSLTPLPSALDRDYLLFHAGRASVRGPGWFWPTATGFLLLVTAGLSFVVLYRPVQRLDPQIVERVVYVPSATTPPPAVTPSERVNLPPTSDLVATYAGDEDREKGQAENMRIRQQLFRFGVESLPAQRANDVVEKPLPMDPLMGLPASTLDDSAGRLLLGTSLHSGY
jgi:hypothetical protein